MYYKIKSVVLFLKFLSNLLLLRNFGNIYIYIYIYISELSDDRIKCGTPSNNLTLVPKVYYIMSCSNIILHCVVHM